MDMENPKSRAPRAAPIRGALLPKLAERSMFDEHPPSTTHITTTHIIADHEPHKKQRTILASTKRSAIGVRSPLLLLCSAIAPMPVPLGLCNPIEQRATCRAVVVVVVLLLLLVRPRALRCHKRCMVVGHDHSKGRDVLTGCCRRCRPGHRNGVVLMVILLGKTTEGRSAGNNVYRKTCDTIHGYRTKIGRRLFQHTWTGAEMMATKYNL